jgi:hypothetical protein
LRTIKTAFLITTYLARAVHCVKTELWERCFVNIHVSLFLAREPPVGQGLLIHKVSRSHTTTHHSHQDSSGRAINSSQDLYLTTHNTHNRQTSMPRWDSNPHSQQASGSIPTPQTEKPLRTDLYAYNHTALIYLLLN